MFSCVDNRATSDLHDTTVNAGRIQVAHPYRGSRKHVLDWVASPAFVVELNDMIAVASARVSPANDHWMPTGADANEARLETTGLVLLPDRALGATLASWWLSHRRGANTPNWDLAASCTLSGRRGIILVEAKAHEGELEWNGKRPPDPGNVVKKLQHGEYSYHVPGRATPVRATTRPGYFDDHSDSMELWSQGNPLFPAPDDDAPGYDPDFPSIGHCLRSMARTQASHPGMES